MLIPAFQGSLSDNIFLNQVISIQPTPNYLLNHTSIAIAVIQNKAQSLSQSLCRKFVIIVKRQVVSNKFHYFIPLSSHFNHVSQLFEGLNLYKIVLKYIKMYIWVDTDCSENPIDLTLAFILKNHKIFFKSLHHESILILSGFIKHNVDFLRIFLQFPKLFFDFILKRRLPLSSIERSFRVTTKLFPNIVRIYMMAISRCMRFRYIRFALCVNRFYPRYPLLTILPVKHQQLCFLELRLYYVLN